MISSDMRIGQGDRLVSSFVTGLSLSSFQVGLDDLCRDFGRYCLGLLQLQGLDKVMTKPNCCVQLQFYAHPAWVSWRWVSLTSLA